MRKRTLPLISLLSVALAACAVGPDYVRPADPQVDAFVRQDASAQATPQPADAEFWRSFNDPLLERLVDASLLHNHDLRIAYANWQQANALLRGAKYDRLPTLTASAEAGDVRASADQMPGVANEGRDYEDYSARIGAVWELDFFGRIRRSVEAQRADAEAGAADLAAMQVAVVGEVARSYFQLRGWQEQLRIARENAENQARTQQLLQVRFDNGLGSSFDVDRGRTQLEGTRSRIPALEAEVAVATHRIAVLTGVAPESLVAELETAGELPAVPTQTVAVDAPGELLRRRPDVAAAERRLHAATARIGVATAELFPRFSLGALFGTQAFDAAALFARDSETRLLTLGIDGSFLNVGRVRARIAAANAAAAGDLAAYERAVLVALEETENALVRVSRSSREVGHLQAAAEAGARATQVARLRHDNGAIDVLELLDAERSSLQAEDAHAQGRVRNALAQVSLYQALAGGWPRYVPDESVALEK